MTRWAFISLASLAFAQAAHADTLRDAIAAAYSTNPDLAEAYERQVALAELPIQARADGRPVASVQSVVSYDDITESSSGNANLVVGVPLWTGGRVSSAVRSAKAEVEAGEQVVRDREAEILERVVTVYAELLFAQEAVEVATIGIERLDRQVEEARNRFDLGDATLTDVARLRAQRASVVSDLADARAALLSAQAAYLAVVGNEASDLSSEVPSPRGLPDDLASARLSAQSANPRILESSLLLERSAARVDEARAQRAPRIDLEGTYGRSVERVNGNLRGFDSAANVGVRITIPILTGGLVPSRIREEEANRRADRFALDSVTRETIFAVDSIWASLEAAQLRVGASKSGLEVAQLALNGVRAEYEFGLRSTLDILAAEESLRLSQLALARAQSDVLIAQAQLLRATGRLDREAYL